jgi:hypothetical protein
MEDAQAMYGRLPGGEHVCARIAMKGILVQSARLVSGHPEVVEIKATIEHGHSC